MNVYDVFCNEKKGYWRISADTKKEAIYEATKGRDSYTGVHAIKVN